MCVNYFIGLFHLNLEQLVSGLDQVLPDEALAVIADYLGYASQTQSPALSGGQPGYHCTVRLRRAAHPAAQAMDELYQARNRTRRACAGWWLSVVLSLLFLLTIYLSVVVIFTGDWFFHLLETHLPHPPAAPDPPAPLLSSLWLWMRYLLLFCFVLLLVLAIYRLGTPRRFRSSRNVLLPSVPSSPPWLTGGLLGCLFSWFIGMSSRYSLVYGSLASLIILLVWLYFCGNILLLGALLSRVLEVRRARHRSTGS